MYSSMTSIILMRGKRLGVILCETAVLHPNTLINTEMTRCFPKNVDTQLQPSFPTSKNQHVCAYFPRMHHRKRKQTVYQTCASLFFTSLCFYFSFISFVMLPKAESVIFLMLVSCSTEALFADGQIVKIHKRQHVVVHEFCNDCLFVYSLRLV